MSARKKAPLNGTYWMCPVWHPSDHQICSELESSQCWKRGKWRNSRHWLQDSAGIGIIREDRCSQNAYLGNPLCHLQWIWGTPRPGHCRVKWQMIWKLLLCCVVFPKLCVMPVGCSTQFGKHGTTHQMTHTTQKQLLDCPPFCPAEFWRSCNPLGIGHNPQCVNHCSRDITVEVRVFPQWQSTCFASRNSPRLNPQSSGIFKGMDLQMWGWGRHLPAILASCCQLEETVLS